MQINFYFDPSRCIGCYACVAACRSWNQLEQEMPDLIGISTREQGEFPNVSLSHLFITCFHCAEPACVPACPDDLLVKRPEDGIVAISSPEHCTSCQLCTEACPYDAPKIVTLGKTSIVKCDLCKNRISEGRPPACVAACPTEALDAGLMEELVVKHGEVRGPDGFPDCHITKPSLVFRGMTPIK